MPYTDTSTGWSAGPQSLTISPYLAVEFTAVWLPVLTYCWSPAPTTGKLDPNMDRGKVGK